MLKRIGNFMLALLAFGIWFITILVCQTIALLICMIGYGMDVVEATPALVFAGHIGFILVFGLWYAFGLRKYRHTKKSVKKVVTFRNIGGILVLSLGMAFLISFGLVLVEPLIPESIIEAYAKIVEEAQLGESLFTNIAGCLLAPIGEELIFRGVILYFLMKSIKGLKNEKVLFWVMNLVQAVLFGVFHMNVYQGMYATVIGLLIGYLAYKSNTILVPMLVHMTYNVMQLLVMEPIGSSLPENMVLYAVIAVVGFVVMVVGIRMLKFPKEETETKEIAA